MQQDKQQAPVLIPEKSGGKNPKELGPEKSEKEVAQLLSKMVKWQQTLIAFILGFVFLVMITVMGIFAGPQLMRMVRGPVTSDAAVSAAAGATGNNAEAAAPLAVQESTGTTITQQDIDSLYAAIRAQVESELRPSLPSALQISSTDNAGRVPEPRSNQPTSPPPRQRTSTPPPTPPEQEEAQSDTPPPASRQETVAENNTPTPEPEVDASLASADQTEPSPEEDDSTVEDPVSSSDEEIQELLRQREFQMYRSMGDSLLSQGFEDLALQWYQSALQQNPDDIYVNDQIKKLENKEEETLPVEPAVESPADSLSRRISESMDETGVFFAPDVPPTLIERDRVYNRVRYPRICLNQTEGGRVIARTVVDEAGIPTELSIAKSLHPACDEEVLRVLSEASFVPAIFNNEPVKAWFAFSVVFRKE